MNSDTHHMDLDPDHYSQLGPQPVVDMELATAAATRKLGRWLAEHVEDRDFIGLVGTLGAGKTTLMQGLVDGMKGGKRWEATSPTYSLIQIYETEPPVYHMDLYRLEGWADLESIGYWDYIESRRGVACVEWLDRIPGAWPGQGLIVELIADEKTRRVRLWGDEQWATKTMSLDELTLHPAREQRGPDE